MRLVRSVQRKRRLERPLNVVGKRNQTMNRSQNSHTSLQHPQSIDPVAPLLTMVIRVTMQLTEMEMEMSLLEEEAQTTMLLKLSQTHLTFCKRLLSDEYQLLTL